MKTKRIGNWILEWQPERPSLVWAIPQYTKTLTRGDSGIMYDDGTMAWDYPDMTPLSVRTAAPQFIRKCQDKRVS